MKRLTKTDYDSMVKQASPGSNTGRNLPLAFLIGGLICAIGEGFIHLYTHLGLTQETATATASITLVFIAALLTGLDVYDTIAQYAGAGTLVPITGFSNSVVSPALEFKSEGYVLGLGAKMFTIAGPVLVYGYATGVLYGLLVYLFGLY